MNKGKFIVLEGIDGSGKSLQTSLIISWLDERGYDTLSLQEPTRGTWGMKIREIVSGKGPSAAPDEELELFIRDREDNITRNIIPALETGKIVVQDRYYYSTMAYQGARGFEPEEIKKRHGDIIIEPDIVLILDLTPEEGLRRISDNRKSELSIFEKQSYLESVKRIYDSFRAAHIHHVDAFRNPEVVQNEIRTHLEKIL